MADCQGYRWHSRFGNPLPREVPRSANPMVLLTARNKKRLLPLRTAAVIWNASRAPNRNDSVRLTARE